MNTVFSRFSNIFDIDQRLNSFFFLDFRKGLYSTDGKEILIDSLEVVDSIVIRGGIILLDL